MLTSARPSVARCAPSRRQRCCRRIILTKSSPGASIAGWIETNLDCGRVTQERSHGGSGWARTYIYETANGSKFFVKTAGGSDDTMFKGEALGLQAMFDTNTVCVPRVFFSGSLPGGRGSAIVMEYLDMGGRADQAELGRQLAHMHLATPKDESAAAGLFGFPVDNTIGGTAQPNGWMSSWVDFFRERRLKHQLRLAGDSRLSALGDKLAANLEGLFEGAGTIRPATLHGDLWSGNMGTAKGRPVIFDPATYYGHHEAEFGMSWCAGFSSAFYDAYHEIIPRAPGFEQRTNLYLLYHYLNHLNLFGDGYYSQCEGLLKKLTKGM